MSKNILLIGPMTNVEKGLVGGATISFGYLVDFLRSKDESVRVINTKRYFGVMSSVRNAIYILCKLGLNLAWVDLIFLNTSRGGAKYAAPLMFYCSKLVSAHFVFRPFGGGLVENTKNYGPFFRWLFKNTVLKADILYLQTKELVDFYQTGIQLTTSRKKAESTLKTNPTYSRRFIYLGFVNEDKGVDQVIEAAIHLGDDYTVHIYGPIKEDRFNDLPAELYKGVLHKEEVLPTLCEYDVLLLPTHYEGEGYPGSIIEAYSVGLPVITTRWKAIPEIVEHEKTGLLIDVRSPAQLIKAMKSIDKDNYPNYSRNALNYFYDTFDEEKVLGKVRDEINAL